MILKSIQICLCAVGLMAAASAEVITLIQGENGYNGYVTDNYGNEAHNAKFGPNTTKHPWVWDDPWTGSNFKKADVADYCC
jgi:hypothetical protein